MLKRSEVITKSGCPVCYGELSSSDNTMIPIETKCPNCGQYHYSYHGMGDGWGRVGKYSWSDCYDSYDFDEQKYLQAIVYIRNLLAYGYEQPKEDKDGKENLYSF